MVKYWHMIQVGYWLMQWNKKEGYCFMNKQQEKVFNETRIRNLRRRYVQCIDKGEIEDAIDIKLEIDQLQKRI